MAADAVFGRYRLLAKLGQGGMGEVWRAHDIRKDRRVALKILGPWLAAEPGYTARFRREAALAARLNDPNIIPIHDFGEIDGRLYIEMPLIAGHDLGVMLDRDGPLSPERAVRIVAQVADALDTAHEAGLVHRDVKPSNVLVTGQPGRDFAYLIDFGIAAGVGATTISVAGGVVGTPTYMAPERFEGAGDHRSDVYALACLLHAALTGQAPFSAPTGAYQLGYYLIAHRDHAPPRPSTINSCVPAAFDAVVATGMAKKPADRYASAGDLSTAARRALDASARAAEIADKTDSVATSEVRPTEGAATALISDQTNIGSTSTAGSRGTTATATSTSDVSKGRTFRRALLATAAAVLPGAGLFIIDRRRSGGFVLGTFLLIVFVLTAVWLTADTTALATTLMSGTALALVMVGVVVAALAWTIQIVRTYSLARPRGLDRRRRASGIVFVAALCLVVASPFGYAVDTLNMQRSMLDAVFGSGGGAGSAVITKARLNVLLVGLDTVGPAPRAQTDTIMLASIDTTTARTTLFALPRNVGYAQFPPGSPMAEQFPRGFHGSAISDAYLLNAVYSWGLDHPQIAPNTPSDNAGVNLLQQTVGYMLGVDVDYFLTIDMAGFAAIIDALGGVTVDVGPTPLAIGGVLADGQLVKPSGYVPAGVQHLNGDQALWFARSRRDSDDYNRMGRQRCLLQSLLQQKSPTDVIAHLQVVATAATRSVSTNMPQEVVGALATLAREKAPSLQAIAFDPSLPDPNEPDGRFNPGHIDVAYVRQVVQDTVATQTSASQQPAVGAPAATAVQLAEICG